MDEAEQPPARRRSSKRQRSAVERLRKAEFPVAMRGYDRAAVDRYVAEVAQVLGELEATQTREGVVQRALDEVGEQTSGILQHAHDAAEEIAAQSRAQAEGRLQRAEREADETRREADSYSEQVVKDTRRLWQDRQRLIEDMRQLADEVLNLSDDALERLEQPDTGFGRGDGDLGADAGQAEDPDLPQEADPTTEVWTMRDEPPAEDTTAESAVDEPSDEQPDDPTTTEFRAPAARERGD
jgi:DivIVA domain-containing protein